MKSILCAFALLLALFVPSARAQAVADSPEAVAEAMYARMQAGDMRGVAALFDPAALKEFRGMMAPVVELLADQDAPAEAFEPLLGKVAPGQLKSASDADFFATMLGGIIGRSGARLESQQVIGSVAEGADLRHVLTRNTTSAMGMTFTKMEVVSLHRVDGAWRVLLNGDIKGMAEVMGRSLRAASDAKSSAPGHRPRPATEAAASAEGGG